ncbi:hypothetical protein MTO96_041209, partial [Rhipicephalus appendiculatus]
IHGYDLGLPLCHSVWNISCPGTSVAEHITLCCAEHEVALVSTAIEAQIW